MEAYLDNAATTPVLPEVTKIMQKVMEEDFGNPSSRHTKGFDAEKYIRETADIISAQLKCAPKEIIFTSGGTEANNQALIGTAIANRRVGKHVITTAIEHASVYKPMEYLEEMGYEVSYLPVDEKGQLSIDILKEAMREDTFLVSVMYVNNEIGSVQRIEEIGRFLKKNHPNVLFHVDAIQAFGKYKIVPGKSGIDFMSVSAHKMHGPKGIGFLYASSDRKLRPILFGGGQQRGLRSGTENVPGIAGLGVAVKCAYEEHPAKIEKLFRLRKQFCDAIVKVEDVVIHGPGGAETEGTAPHIVSVGFAGIKSEVLLHALAERGVYVSSGSACSSNHPELSGTLKAIGVKKEFLDSTLRFSFSMLTTEEEVDYAIEEVGELLPRLRRFTRH